MAFSPRSTTALASPRFWRSVTWSLAALITVSALYSYIWPFVWILFAWALVLVLELMHQEAASRRLLLLNAAVVLATVGAVEAWWSFEQVQQRRRAKDETPTYSPGYTVAHGVLGYAPRPGTEAVSRKVVDGKLVYDVRYTIDAAGLRIGPSCDRSRESEGIVFFGGSYTFGEGLRDAETFPYQTGIRTHCRYAVYNLGFHGYGPHQMLAALEKGVVDRIVQPPVAFGIYLGMAGHVPRAAGEVQWDGYGPRYVLNGAGELSHLGAFLHTRPAASGLLDRVTVQLRKSAVLERLFPWIGQERQMRLYVSIVDKARRVFEERFPGSEFHVIFWDEDARASRALLEGLAQREVRVHRVSRILPDVRARSDRYHILGDGHPNALAHRELARYVVDDVISADG